jgi:hypothetical protein
VRRKASAPDRAQACTKKNSRFATFDLWFCPCSCIAIAAGWFFIHVLHGSQYFISVLWLSWRRGEGGRRRRGELSRPAPAGARYASGTLARLRARSTSRDGRRLLAPAPASAPLTLVASLPTHVTHGGDWWRPEAVLHVDWRVRGRAPTPAGVMRPTSVSLSPHRTVRPLLRPPASARLVSAPLRRARGRNGRRPRARLTAPLALARGRPPASGVGRGRARGRAVARPAARAGAGGESGGGAQTLAALWRRGQRRPPPLSRGPARTYKSAAATGREAADGRPHLRRRL